MKTRIINPWERFRTSYWFVPSLMKEQLPVSIRLINLWYSLRSSLWFAPTLLAVVAVGLAAGTLLADQRLATTSLRLLGPLGTISSDGARAVLITVAGSIIAIAGVAFSITIVSLTLASTQFGPRLLRAFLKDHSNQIVLGIFIATFLYSLLIVAAVRETAHDPFIPRISVACSLLFALASLGAFIYFIHNISTSIYADNVIAEVTKDLFAAIDRLTARGSTIELQANPEAMELQREHDSVAIRALSSGYLQAIDYAGLIRVAAENDVLFTLKRRPGDFVIESGAILTMSPPKAAGEELRERVNAAFILGSHRTEEQDIEFAIHQLVEVALRALSPGINDPFTSISCIDWLGAAVSHLAKVGLPSPYHYDNAQQLRVVADTPNMAGIVDAAFSQIRQRACGDVAVTIRLLETFAGIASCTRNTDVRGAIRRHAEMVHAASQSHLDGEADRRDVEERFESVRHALNNRQDLRSAS